MSSVEIMSSEFENYIKEATNRLKNYQYEEAYHFIMKAISENPNAPQPHNLLGIWYEFQKNNDLARKHYRVAYVLNPIYKPATVNLERVSTLFPYKDIEVDFGEELTEVVGDVRKDGKVKATTVKKVKGKAER